MQLFIRLSLVVILACFSALAFATNVCTSQNPSECLDGVGPAVTNPDNIRVSSSNIGRDTFDGYSVLLTLRADF